LRGFWRNARKKPDYPPQFRQLFPSELPVGQSDKGDGIMLAYLMFSLIFGAACAGISLLGFGVSLWMAALWYVLGCWAGFGLSVTVFLLIERNTKPGHTDMRPEYS
jgi:hypothetical protein